MALLENCKTVEYNISSVAHFRALMVRVGVYQGAWPENFRVHKAHTPPLSISLPTPMICILSCASIAY